ncbi:MAG: TlpA disulfide reductase family protein [Nitrospira sp.]
MRPVGIAFLGLTVLLLVSLRDDLGWGVSTLTPSPEFELVTSTGDVISNATLRSRPALLVFWAPWCNVCRKELPELANFYRRDKPEQLRVLSIGFADLRSNVETFVKARPEVFVFPTAYDEDRWVAQAFKVRVTPTYVLLDADGQVALTHFGGGLLQNEQFQAFLRKFKKS